MEPTDIDIIETNDAIQIKELLQILYSMYDTMSDTDILSERVIRIILQQTVLDKEYILNYICLLVDTYLHKHKNKTKIIQNLFRILSSSYKHYKKLPSVIFKIIS